ncbi:helix-turn-helix domain-containing protein [Marinicella litoralis]|uniref:DNA-binding XRE family transcriptional regulator n=1 Tax=Marinicella litoralis TaxID=644220 RepID=A0A4R6XV92_9GAMM|nr:helix-turn-helix transcriptional regulator [Marinicella litoralis]TDR22300.1 DNA-binding XRE family transcriptional regulator [Marinicella litoralis]
MVIIIDHLLPMSFPSKLIQIRKSQGLTQQALADTANIHINQIRRYEAGSSQPTLEGLIKLAKSLHVSIDELVFDGSDRAPTDKMKLMFEAVANLGEKEQDIIQELLEGMLVKYESRRWDSGRQAAK